MPYQVKEIFLTLQGEGGQAGRPAVFCRFTGCNLWSGREEDRSESPCWFCDTDFVGTNGVNGGRYRTAAALVDVICSLLPVGAQESSIKHCVVFTGGEPLLQLDDELISEVKANNLEIAVETNGTQPAPEGIDWLTVSPKPNAELVQRRGKELKLVYPDVLPPEENYTALDFEFFYLSPRWTASEADRELHIAKTAAYCRTHPQWRMSLQFHKIWGLP